MSFEVGKQYVFQQNQFSVSREAGKLCFLVPNPASATPYRVKPFEFQSSKIPTHLVCIYKRGDRLEQDLNYLVPELYTVGESYKFRVMRQDGPTGTVSVRDDLNGVTFYPIDLGQHHFSRFERITCKVESTQGGKLRLKLEADTTRPTSQFTLETLAALPQARRFERLGLSKRILASSLFSEAAMMRRGGDPSWVLAVLDVIKKYLPQWLAGNLRLRLPWIKAVKELTIHLIENSDYLKEYAPEERLKKQEQLAAFVNDCDDYIEATSLILAGSDEQFIKDTLQSIQRTGWLYNPEKKMRLMMALFTLRNDYAHSYISEIFRVIRERHGDSRFLEVFGRGFIVMLSIFITNESKFVDPYNRDLLRELIEAIAIELLLTKDMEYDVWNLHRGMLYTFASLIVDRAESSLPAKAVDSFAELYEAPLEFGWHDLDDITRLCYSKLHTDKPIETAGSEKTFTVYEGENSRLALTDHKMSIVPVAIGDSTRQALERKPLPGRTFTVLLNSSLDEKTHTESPRLDEQRAVWSEIEERLKDLPTKEEATKPAVKVAKSVPEAGKEVLIRFTHQDAEEKHTFHCTIVDDTYEGEGTIMTRDIVPYPVSVNIATFRLEGQQMLLPATITSVDADGTCHFDMSEQVSKFLERQSRNDKDTQETMDAVITEVRPDKYMGVCWNGYPFQLFTRYCPEELTKMSRIRMNVDKVMRNYQTDKLFINARYVDTIIAATPEENYELVGDAFQFVIDELCDHRVYTDPEEEEEAEVTEETKEEETEEIEENYLDSRTMGELSRLLDFMAIINRRDQWTAYNLLAMARLLALMVGDMYRADYLQAKMSLMEALQQFGLNGSIDDTTLQRLVRRCESFVRLRDADIIQQLETLRALNAMDKIGMTAASLPSVDDKSNLAAVKRMVGAYNLLRGLQLNTQRQEIRRRIYELLNIQMPQVDVNSLSVREDLHNEFKESLVYPADNNMKADQKRQTRELMEVICGMMNTEGGTLYIGVGNLGVVRGLASDFVYLNNGFAEYDIRDVEDKFSLTFNNALYEHFGLTYEGTPVTPGLVTLAFEDIGDKWICRINVKAYRGMVRMTDGSVFLRQESSTRPLKTKREQAEFLRQRMAAE